MTKHNKSIVRGLKVLLAATVTQALLFIVTPINSSADITKTAVWQGAHGIQTCYTADEKSIFQASSIIWGKPQKIFSNPVRMDMFESDGGIQHFFVADKNQQLFRYFGSQDKYLKFFVNYTGGPQLKCPTGVAVQPDETESDYHKLFILDTGNSAIQAYNVNRVNQNINYLGAIYSSNSNGGHGPLKRASDLAYCYFELASCGGLLVVADTDNHRVLIMRTDGTVVHEIGGPGPGSGMNQFRYPSCVAAVGLNNLNCEAFIYIGDKGNNRIVCLYLDENQDIHWYKSVQLPISDEDARGDTPDPGIVAIAVDDWFKNGVWVLDSRRKEVIQFDQFLEQEIQTFSGMDYKGNNLVDLTMHAGQMAILGPYTWDSGFELFEIRASFFNVEAAPHPFDPDFEWLTLKFTSSAEGYLDAWVIDSTGTTVVHDTSLAKDNFVFAQVNYLVWDGRNDAGQRLPAGRYRINLQVKDAAWQSTELKQISIRVKQSNLKVLATHKTIADPRWSPDGSYIVCSVDDDIPYNGKIAKINMATFGETILTPAEGLGNRYPSWSHAGDKIAFTKYTKYIQSFEYWGAGVFVMDANGQNVQLISDTSAWNCSTDPSWIKGGTQISYVRYNRDANPPFRILAHDMQTGANQTVYLPDNIDKIYRHLWSPREDEIAMAVSRDSSYHLFSYDIATGIRSQMTFADADDADEEKSFSYSADGQKLGFLEKLWRLSNASWKLCTIPSSGGTKIPISGMSSDVIDTGPGMSWSPDGTKIAFIQRYAANDQLVVSDYIRNSDAAFPAALITRPFAGGDVNGIVGIVGAVKNNVSVNGDTLSRLADYSIEFGAGKNPYSWYTTGIELAKNCLQGDCQITNDTLALWNTGLLGSGTYTLRLTARGGTNSNVIYRCVDIRHRTIRVKKNGTGDFLTVQAAIDAAESGDTVLVYAGDYAEHVVMKEAVHLIGAEDGVRIKNPDTSPSISVKIEHHKLPCSIRNIVIRNDDYRGPAVGILVNGSSPIITDCLVENQGGSGSSYGCGIRIIGNSNPTFFNCTIRDNMSTYGAGLRMNPASEEFPAPSFYGCSFVGNAADGIGGAVYINYTAADTTHSQPYFNGCLFKDNTTTANGSNGSAVYLGYCHAASFAHCTFLNNRPATAYGNPIYGLYSGARFANCTFKGNAGESGGAVIDLYNGTARVGVNNCIFAYNSLESIRRDGSYFDVEHSCFYENQPVDSFWLHHGTGNFQSNPSFCNRQNNDLHLYSFSPCAPAVSGVDLIGAYGVDCVPQLDSLLYCSNPNIIACPPNSCPDNPTLYVCPEGDYQALVVHVNLADSQMTRNIGAEEIELIPTVTPCVKFFCNGSIHADSAATSSHGWRTTIKYSKISGCGADSLHVTLDGSVIGALRVSFKSPDSWGPGGFADGKVNMSDLTPFAITYQKCQGQAGYNDCYNFARDTLDTCVNVSDFVFWAAHYADQAPCIGTVAQTSARVGSEVILRLLAQLEIIDTERYLNVSVVLENARNLKSTCLALEGEKYGLEFLSWEENTAQEGTIMAAPITKDGSNMFFIALVAQEGIQADSICIGTVRYRMKTDDPSRANDRLQLERMSLVTFGDVMTSDGVIKGIGGAGIEIQSQVAKYYDYLKNCYPNPFNPTTTIEYSISRDSHVNLSVYNVNGQLVRVLVNEKKKRNVYSASWDGKDNGGRTVASGIYFCRLKSDFFEKSQKLILLR